MNNLNNTDDIVECPLCMEPLEVDDLNFFPCTCGYQICRFCWHRIRTDENQLCPACRKEYPENPADFKPLSQEEMVAFKFQKRQRDQKRKQEITENRKHLANVRVVQKNLVFVVGLPPRLADAEILKKHEYFGKYGKIHKVVINPSTTYAGVQGPSASAYVTYVHNPDALRAIQSVNNITIDGRLIKTSLGTTKYCSHFMKNQQCPKSDCMYLHELGDPEASFTKEEMHQGKHQDYEKRLHEALIATAGSSTTGGGLVSTTTPSSSSASSGGILSGNGKSTDSSYKSSGLATSKSANAINNGHDSSSGGTTAPAVNGGQQSSSEAWPSLFVWPVIKKDEANPANGGPKSKKERQKQEKTKPEKNGKAKNKNSNSTSNNNNNHNNNSNSNTNPASKDPVEATHTNNSKSATAAVADSDKTRTTDKDRDRKQQQQQQQQNSHSTSNNSQNQRKEELPARTETVETSKTNSKTKTASTDSNNSKSQATNSERDRSKNECKQESATPPATTTENTMYVSNSSNSSLSSSSSSSSSTSNSSSSSTASNGNLSSETTTTQQIQKSNSVEEPLASATATTTTAASPPATTITTSDSLEKSATCPFTESIERTAASIPDNFSVFGNKNKSPLYNGINSSIDEGDKIKNSIESTQSATLLSTTISDVPKLSLFDDRSFFSLNPDKISQMPPLQQQQQHTASLLNNKLLEDPLLTGRTMPNLPDLINGIDGYQSNLNCSNDWEDAFKSVILKTNKQMEEKMQQQQQLQQHLNSHLHLKTQEDLRKLQELQKRNILLNSMRVSQLGGPLGPLGSDLGRHSHFMAQQNPLLQHQPNLSSENLLQNSAQLPFETNMSKFFDFHKHQQQQKLQHYGGGIGGPAAGGLGSLSDNFHMMSLLENKPLNSQLLDPNSLLNSHLQQQQQKQKQQLYGKIDPMMHHQQQLQQQQALNKNLSNMHGNQNHLKSQYLQNSNADDDLGFDPFIETQKALAELIENEEEQQQLQQHNHVPTSHSNPIGPPKQPQTQPTPPHQQDPMLEYMQRLRMPPPGFSHHNSNLGGYGGMDPRMHSNQNSKMLPFMNLPGTNNGGAGNPPHMAPQQQQTHPLQMPNPNVWSSHLGNMQQQQQQGMGLRHDNLGQPQNMGNQKPGYSSGGGSDWTAMDPAILSFRQFSFPQQQQQNQMGPPQMPPPPQQQQQQPPPQDMFLQHLSQQAAGFGLGGGPPGGNGQMPNGQHHNSQGHLNVDASVQGMLEYLKTHQFV
uniref:CCR4-NOT transcription complex subunit 4 n=1 Tax=Musca domestica TaxID=7370 RepID=A0A1I8NA68_MUSDO